jgi:hypothetical protein
LEDCQRAPQLHKIHFILDDDNGNAQLIFLLDSDVKRCELLRLDCFRQLDDDKVANQVSYRIESLRKKRELITNRLFEVMKILEENNPPLVEQVKRTVRGRAVTDPNGLTNSYNQFLNSQTQLMRNGVSAFKITD